MSCRCRALRPVERIDCVRPRPSDSNPPAEVVPNPVRPSDRRHLETTPCHPAPPGSDNRVLRPFRGSGELQRRPPAQRESRVRIASDRCRSPPDPTKPARRAPPWSRAWPGRAARKCSTFRLLGLSSTGSDPRLRRTGSTSRAKGPKWIWGSDMRLYFLFVRVRILTPPSRNLYRRVCTYTRGRAQDEPHKTYQLMIWLSRVTPLCQTASDLRTHCLRTTLSSCSFGLQPRPEEARFAGRVEHIATGNAKYFDSQGELWDVLSELLPREASRTTGK